jgi:hypothetical protein
MTFEGWFSGALIAVPKVTTTGLAWLTAADRALSLETDGVLSSRREPLNNDGFAIGIREADGFFVDIATDF